MLENMRRQGASIFVYLIFCLLILIFVINFGPQRGNGGEGGCRGTSNVVVSVNGEEATNTAYHIAYATRYNTASGKQKTWLALEFLIRREILAQEAESRGLMVTGDMIDSEIKAGHFYFGGRQATIPGAIETVGDETFYNHKAVKAWANELNVSLNSYKEEQERGLLASMMAQILEDSIVVSREEALDQFLFEGNTAVYDVVAFKPEIYSSSMKLTDADVDRFLTTHAADVAARYKADERTYKADKPQLLLRQIFIAKPVAAGSGSAAAPDDGKAKLEAARTAIGSSKDKFAAQAKTLNTDDAAKNAAGELGWRTLDNPMLGDKALSDAVKTLKPGDMTPVITTDKGSYLIMAEDKREGDLSFDQVKREIAKELARDTWSKEAAKRAAIAALDHARSGVAMNLSDLYEKDKTENPQPGGMDLDKIINNPNLTDEQKKAILQQLLQQQQGQGGAPGGDEGDGPHGALEVESTDTPAGWFADANGGGGSSGSAAVPAAGSGAGSGAGSAATAPATPPAPTVSDANTPSKDQLPAMADVPKAHVTRYGPAPRSTSMPGLGSSKAAIAAVFDELSAGNLAKQVYEADGDYIVVQLIQREKPNVADFDKDADARVAALREQRAQSFLNDWLKERCLSLAKDGKIHPNPELLAERDDQGRLLQSQYRPCISFR